MANFECIVINPPRTKREFIHVQYEAEKVVKLDITPQETGFVRQESDLVVRDQSGDLVILVDFFLEDGQGLPDFLMPDGTTLSSVAFFRLYSPELDLHLDHSLSAGSGVGEYLDFTAGLIGGVGRLEGVTPPAPEPEPANESSTALPPAGGEPVSGEPGLGEKTPPREEGEGFEEQTSFYDEGRSLAEQPLGTDGSSTADEVHPRLDLFVQEDSGSVADLLEPDSFAGLLLSGKDLDWLGASLRSAANVEESFWGGGSCEQVTGSMAPYHPDATEFLLLLQVV